MKVLKSPFFWFGVFFLAPAAVVLADSLVPCGLVPFTSGQSYIDSTGCNFCYLAKLIQNIVNFLLMVAIPISVAMFAWAGITYFTAAGNPKKIDRGRRIFVAVFLGFCIAVSGWFFVQVGLQAVTNQQFFTANNWVSLDCSTFNGQRPRNLALSTVLSGNGAVSTATDPNAPATPTTPSAPAEGTYSDAEARIQLGLANLSINKDNCPTAASTDCTSFTGIRKDTITQTINLAEACGCTFVVTGGTEAGHSPGDNSHTQGYKVDISLGAVDSYITGTMTSIGPRAGDNAPQYQDRYGNVYARESNHWDIYVVKSGVLPSR